MASIVDPRKSVTTCHASYEALKGKWKRCRDASAGQDALRAGAQSYIPMLSEQTPKAYDGYLKRATYYNATKRTINGLVGMMFRRPVITEVPAGIKDFMDDITMAGEPLDIFAQELAREAFEVGRAGMLVDYPQMDTSQSVTVAQAEAMGLRPMLQRYTAESIINWRCGPVNNVNRLLMVVLTEEMMVMKDEFAGETKMQYRVLDLVPDAADATQLMYRMRVFQINDQTDAQEMIGPEKFPMMNGKPIRDIPFVFMGVDSITPDTNLPPLIDLVDLNIAHFRVFADYEHGCHVTGLPTPYISGYQAQDGEKLSIGSTAAWVFPDPSTHVGFLEFTGGGLAALVENLDRKEAQMAAIGARLLAADKRLNETATTAAIHHGGETSILSAVAQVMSLALTKALTIFAEWAGATGNVDFDINRDFFPVPMDAPTLQALVASWQAGAISAQVLFENLQEGEIINSDATFEQEQAKIANAPPQGGNAGLPSVSDKSSATSGTYV